MLASGGRVETCVMRSITVGVRSYDVIYSYVISYIYTCTSVYIGVLCA